MSKLTFLAPAVVTAFVVSSCGTSSSSVFTPGDGTDGGAAANGGNGSTGPLGGGTTSGSCSSNNAAEGCSCDPANAPGACWTGPAGDRHRGACKDGSAQCLKKGEFYGWGPCEGQVLDCGTAGTTGGNGNNNNGDDAGVANPQDGSVGVTGTNGGPCPCVPGAVIWCDEDCVSNVYCSRTGQKECLPDGTWTGCHETSTTKPPNACELVGLGCASCDSGRGYLLGNCASAFTCGLPPQPPNCSVSAVVNNGVATVTCNCK